MLNRDTFTANRATSTGPLDVAKSAGSDLTEFEAPDMGGEESPQSPDSEQQRNRLGYTVTEPTEDEIDGGDKTADDPLDDGDNTQKEMINHAPSGGGL